MPARSPAPVEIPVTVEVPLPTRIIEVPGPTQIVRVADITETPIPTRIMQLVAKGVEDTSIIEPIPTPQHAPGLHWGVFTVFEALHDGVDFSDLTVNERWLKERSECVTVVVTRRPKVSVQP